MGRVTAYEAKTRFGRLLARVARGEEVVITRHDKPVARLVPDGVPDLAATRKAVAALRGFRTQIQKRSAPKLSRSEVKSAVQEGRR